MSTTTNVFGRDLAVCGLDPMTGWNRDGKCSYRAEDGGRHLVCATMTKRFLEFTKAKGNDLSTPSETFPGLKEGDNWCICAERYSEAARENEAPTLVLEATNEKALQWELVRQLLTQR